MNLLTFFTPLTIYKSKTQSGDTIEVRELFGSKKLDVGGYPQSGTKYIKCWKNIFRKIGLVKLPDSGNALVLGLGGGDIARLLEKIKPNWKATYVEIEPEIVSIAKKYFYIDKTKLRKILTEDAKMYLENSKEKFDLIIVDLYNGDDVPIFVKSESFLKNASLSLKPKGSILINYASHRFHEKDFISFYKLLEKIFSKVTLLRYWGHSFYLTQN